MEFEGLEEKEKNQNVLKLNSRHQQKSTEKDLGGCLVSNSSVAKVLSYICFVLIDKGTCQEGRRCIEENFAGSHRTEKNIKQ